MKKTLVTIACVISLLEVQMRHTLATYAQFTPVGKEIHLKILSRDNKEALYNIFIEGNSQWLLQSFDRKGAKLLRSNQYGGRGHD